MTLPSARTPVVDRDKAANVITPGKILRMNASSAQNSTGDAGGTPLVRLVGVRCIAALRRVEKPPASPQLTEPLGPRKAANSRSVKRLGKTGGKSYRG